MISALLELNFNYLKKYFKYLFFVFLFCNTFYSFGESQKTIDSLNVLISKAPEDSNKVNLIFLLGRQYDLYKSKEHINNFITALKLAKKIEFKNGIKKVSYTLINYLFYKDMYDVSMNYCLEYISFLEKEGIEEEKFRIYNILGSLYLKQEDYVKSRHYYDLARDYFLSKNDMIRYANILTNINILHAQQEQYDSALIYSLRALEIYTRNNSSSYMANSLLGIAEVHLKKKDYDNGLKRAKESLSIYYNISEKHGICNCYFVLGQLFAFNNQNDSALTHFKTALAYADTIKMDFMKKDCYENISKTYNNLKKYKEAYDYHVLYKQISDSTAIDKIKSKMMEMEVKYDITKKEGQLKEQAFELEAKNKQRNYLVLIVVVILVLFFISFRAYNQKKKANSIISEQKKLVDEKQKEVFESINYAKRIQFALLANAELLKQNLPEHFVLFKPKDIVSGDFYWATKKDDRFYLAVCDSTGHGVPGAFMSLLNISYLNEAVTEKNISEPNKILDHVRKRLIENISQQGGQDGMDAILLCIDLSDKEKVRLTYSAANNSPVLVSNNVITELNKDKMPVGKGEKKEDFTLHEISYNKGDTLFLYTDGYADQFGGPKGKKFKYKQLNDLLLANALLSPEEQSKVLEISFSNWKGALEQVDDVCIIGIKI